jgi:hypothetical protein
MESGQNFALRNVGLAFDITQLGPDTGSLKGVLDGRDATPAIFNNIVGTAHLFGG